MELKRMYNPFLWAIWLIEGIIVGFGAILPGVSGGTLCVAFGMYRPIIEIMSDIKKGLSKYGIMLLIFFIGVAIGFIGLSGAAAILLERNTELVTCIFIGFILGTFPQLLSEAGSKGRNIYSFVSIVASFVVILFFLIIMKNNQLHSFDEGVFGYLICGILWGFSFIIPGLSSSSLLLFFGLYQPMLEGISEFDMTIIIPMAFGMLLCILSLSKVIGYAYKKHFSIVSHAVIGIAAATVVMIFPTQGKQSLPVTFLIILCSAAVSYILTRICKKIEYKVKKGE